ncbi:MAG: hypothetical protein HYS41_03040 [Candidatus Omnitrophica bacterium]|nr:hypothetical protein [Candidatus Omnitrophota bacterium]
MADKLRGATLALVAVSVAALLVCLGVAGKARGERKALNSLKREVRQIAEANRSLEKTLQQSQAQMELAQSATQELTQALAHEQQKNEHLAEAVRQWEASQKASQAAAAKTPAKKTVSTRRSP